MKRVFIPKEYRPDVYGAKLIVECPEETPTWKIHLDRKEKIKIILSKRINVDEITDEMNVVKNIFSIKKDGA